MVPTSWCQVVSSFARRMTHSARALPYPVCCCRFPVLVDRGVDAPLFSPAGLVSFVTHDTMADCEDDDLDSKPSTFSSWDDDGGR